MGPLTGRAVLLAAAVLTVAMFVPVEAAAVPTRDCGYVAVGKEWRIVHNGQVTDRGVSYHVYTYGLVPSCTQARRWALALTWRSASGALGLAWPDNPRTRGYLIQGPPPPGCVGSCTGAVPSGYQCRRGPDPRPYDVAAVFCRMVPEPKGYARFFFFPGKSPFP